MNFNNVVFPNNVGFKCKNCGTCCKMQPPDVSKTEKKRIEEKGFADFVEGPDENGVLWVKRKEDGGCWFLGEDNKCKIYSVRPQICRLEPFDLVDFDYKKNRIEVDLNFPFTCACVGCDEADIAEVEEIARAAQVLVQKIVSLTANDLGLPVTHKRVLAEARSRLLRRGVERANLQV
ncbi:MAG: YkgJ family cysteine cluster protein [Candidatus Bathyarchaeota archaeon]|nr:YkgJ family cysteine cluster protein [Candidatus Bathyarchaeota archaeon]